VLLTAAHCTSGARGRTVVNVTPLIAREAPSGLPTADPAVGYTNDCRYLVACSGWTSRPCRAGWPRSASGG